MIFIHMLVTKSFIIITKWLAKVKLSNPKIMHFHISFRGKQSLHQQLIGIIQHYGVQLLKVCFKNSNKKKNDTISYCINIGNTERHAIKNFEVLFTPRFLKCDGTQYVNSTIDRTTIECSYSGNPSPTLAWFHQTDERPVKSGPGTGMTIETIDEHHGKYKSILTLEREKLTATPLTTTTTTTTTMTTTLKTANGKSDTTAKPKAAAVNYYQQILNDGFIVKIMHNNEEKGTQKINIITDSSELRPKFVNSSPSSTIQYFSTSIIFSSLLTILYMIQNY